MSNLKKLSLLAIFLIAVTTTLAAVSGAGLGFTASINPDAINGGDGDRPFIVTITNDPAAVNVITAVRLDGNGEFTNVNCEDSFTGAVGNWVRYDGDGYYCIYIAGDGNLGIPAGGFEEFPVTAQVPSESGTYNWRFYIQRPGGWNDNPAFESLDVDTEAPTTSDDYDYTDWVNEDQTITLTATDDLSGVAWTRYCLGEGCEPSSGTDYIEPYTISDEGINYFRYASEDEVGNKEENKEIVVMIDKTDPIVELGDDVSENEAFLKEAAIIDDGLSDNLEYTWGGGGPGIVAFDPTDSGTTTISANTDGEYTITLTVTDSAGNSGSDSFVLTWEATAPWVAITLPAPITNPDWYTGIINMTNHHSETDASNISMTCSYTIGNGGGPIECNAPFLADTNNCPDGTDTCTITITATDDYGNVGSNSVTFSVDNSAPTITNIVLNKTLVRINDTINILSDGTDLQGIKSCGLYITNSTPGFSVYSSMSESTCDKNYTIPSTFADGDYNINIRVRNNVNRDTWGNFSNAFRVDTTPPTLSIATPSVGDWKTTDLFTITTSAIADASDIAECAVTYYDENNVPFILGNLVWNPDTKICSGDMIIPSEAAEGEGTLQVDATDAAGNVFSAGIGLGFDYNAPTINVARPLANEYGTLAVDFELCDYGAGVSEENTQILLDGQEFELTANQTSPDCWHLWTYELAPATGEHVFTIYTEDNLGKSNSILQNVYFQEEYALTLSPGWNLISLPLIPTDSNIQTILGNAATDIAEVWAYNSPATEWQYYYADNPGVSTLTTMEDGKGYWIYVTNPNGAELSFDGSSMRIGPYSPPSYPVTQGWNLIGFKSTNEMPASTYLASIWNSWLDYIPYPIIYIPAQGFSTTPGMLPGYGYWLYAEGEGMIAPPIGNFNGGGGPGGP